jgi:hypothetical protein
MSQRSAKSEAMTRASSKGSTSSRVGNLPFTGRMAPPLLSSSRLDNPAIEAWETQEQPLSSYTFSHQPHQRSNSHRKPNLERVPELVLEDPAAWMARTGGLITPSVSPIVSSTTPAHRLSINTQHEMFGMQIPTTPSSDLQSLTTATTLNSTSMSRQNSFQCENLPESIEMMRFNSQASFSTDINDCDHVYAQVAPHFTSSYQVRRSSEDEQSQLLVGLGGSTSHDSQFPQSFPSAEALVQFPSCGSFGERMEKSHSNESTLSTSSTSSRSKNRLQEQIEVAAARPLMPKGGKSTAMSRDNSSQSMARSQSKDGSQDKVAISKPTYQRPKHDRVYCNQCDDYPDGFRGEHELRRHQDRQHKVMVKKWVCITPSNLNDSPKPAVPLAKCKACTHQQKKYGAYYNAAAHLRRAHFKPRPKGRSKIAKAEDNAKRGGKGGGNWPTMEELKPWMMEVEEMAPNYPLSVAQQEEADASDDEIDDISIVDGTQHLNSQIYQENYTCPSPTDFFGMNMPMTNLDMHSQQSSFCQNAYSSFSNDPYGSSIPQVFEDQYSGLDHVNFPSYQ